MTPFRTRSDILAKNIRLNEDETMALMRETSDFFKKRVPKKLRDLRRCSISKIDLGHALYDLATNINLMLLSIFKKLEFARPEGKFEDVKLIRLLQSS